MKENFEFYHYSSNRHLQRTVSVDKSRLLVFQQNMVILKFGCEKSLLDSSYFPKVSGLIVAARGAMGRMS